MVAFLTKQDLHLSIKIGIDDGKIEQGQSHVFIFSLLLLASIYDLDRSFRAKFRSYFIGKKGVRLLPFLKREQRAYNAIASSFDITQITNFTQPFNIFFEMIKSEIEPESRKEFANFLTKLEIWQVNDRLDAGLVSDALNTQKQMLKSWSELGNQATIHPADLKQQIANSTAILEKSDELERMLEKNQKPLQASAVLWQGISLLHPVSKLEDKPQIIQAKASKIPTLRIKKKKQPANIKKDWAMEIVQILFKRLSRTQKRLHKQEFDMSSYDELFLSNEKFWKKVVGGYSRLDIFMSSFAMLNGLYDYRISRFDELYFIYTEHISLLDIKSLKKFTKNLCDMAFRYFKLASINDSKLYCFDSFSKRLFNITHRSDQRGFTPIVLLLYSHLDKKEFRSCLFLLERFYLFRLLCDQNEDLGLFFWHIFEHLRDTKCKNAKDVLELRLFKDRFVSVPRQSRVMQSLLNLKDNFYARYILFWLELWLRKEHKKWRGRGLGMQYTLEHILPQSYKTHWNIKDDEAVTSLIYQIGNMTLLQDELNVAISNLGWLQKRTIMRLDREPMLINKSILNLSRWSSGHIQSRSKWLSEIFIQIWQPIKDDE